MTQLFNAFNDNLYKTAMVLFVVYTVYNSQEDETIFSGLASGVFILPFVLFSAFAGQLADTHRQGADYPPREGVRDRADADRGDGSLSGVAGYRGGYRGHTDSCCSRCS